LFWQYTSERSELFPIIGIAALFIVFPSATVANENRPFAKHNGRSVTKVLVYRIGFLDLTPQVRTCHLLKHYSFIKQMFLEAGIIIIGPDFSLNWRNRC
jgi:hypothetical protein